MSEVIGRLYMDGTIVYDYEMQYLINLEVEILNRIDQEWPCRFIILGASQDECEVYCMYPEHDPYTNRCEAHNYDLS